MEKFLGLLSRFEQYDGLVVAIFPDFDVYIYQSYDLITRREENV